MAENLIKLVTDMVSGLDESARALLPAVDTQMLDSAYGVWLDYLGFLVGCKPRTIGLNNTYTLNDASYRTLIEAKIAINNGGGTINNFANVVRYTTYLTTYGDWESVKDEPVEMIANNASVFIILRDASLSKVSGLLDYLPAGVGLLVQFIPDNPFAVSDLDNPTPEPTGGGCGSTGDPWSPDDPFVGAGGNLSYFLTL